MAEHEFVLMIDGDLSDESVARALFEAGCDDGTFGVVDGAGYGEFKEAVRARLAAAVTGDRLEEVVDVECIAGAGKESVGNKSPDGLVNGCLVFGPA